MVGSRDGVVIAPRDGAASLTVTISNTASGDTQGAPFVHASGWRFRPSVHPPTA